MDCQIKEKHSISVGYTPSILTVLQWYINDTHWKSVIWSDMKKIDFLINYVFYQWRIKGNSYKLRTHTSTQKRQLEYNTLGCFRDSGIENPVRVVALNSLLPLFFYRFSAVLHTTSVVFRVPSPIQQYSHLYSKRQVIIYLHRCDLYFIKLQSCARAPLGHGPYILCVLRQLEHSSCQASYALSWYSSNPKELRIYYKFERSYKAAYNRTHLLSTTMIKT